MFLPGFIIYKFQLFIKFNNFHWDSETNCTILTKAAPAAEMRGSPPGEMAAPAAGPQGPPVFRPARKSRFRHIVCWKKLCYDE